MITPFRSLGNERIKWVWMLIVIMLVAGTVLASLKPGDAIFEGSLTLDKKEVVFGEVLNINIDTKGKEYEVLVVDSNYMSTSLGSCKHVCSYEYVPTIWMLGEYKVVVKENDSVVHEEKVRYVENIVKVQEIEKTSTYIISVPKSKVKQGVVFEIVNSQGYVYLLQPTLVENEYQAKIPNSFDMKSLKAIETDGKIHFANLDSIEKIRLSEKGEEKKILDENEIGEGSENNLKTSQSVIENSVEISQGKVEVGKPVEWRIVVNNEKGLDTKLIIPENARNLTIKDGLNLDKELEFDEVRIEDGLKNSQIDKYSKGLDENETEQVVSVKNILEERRSMKNKKVAVKQTMQTSSVQNSVKVENLTEMIIDIKEKSEIMEIRYTTPMPEKREEVNAKGKTVVVYSDEEYGYENVSVKTTLTQRIKVENKDKVKLYWVEEDRNLEFVAVDNTGDGFIDVIEWVAPHLSVQTFEIIIEIIQAMHLDQNKEFVQDVYGYVYELDDVWSPVISDGETLRVVFEKNLTKRNDITVYPRVVSGAPVIEVYGVGSEVKVAEFNNIKSEEYNKVYLLGLAGSQDAFDLVVRNGSVEFDYVVDPYQINVETFTILDNGVWTVPSGVYNITVEAWGAGGAGGGAGSNNEGGSGGGGGQYARSVISVVPGQQFTVAVGQGGTGVSEGAGNPGQDTSFNSTVVVAKGGTGGGANDGAVVGIGNQAGSVGDIIYSGGDGTNPAGVGGGGGGGAGSSGVGASASGSTGGIATSENGGIGGDGITASGGNGNPGGNYGAGGGGGRRQGGTRGAGGAGADGFMRLSYEVITPIIINVQSPQNQNYSNNNIWFNATANDAITTWVLNYNGTNRTLANINTSLTVEGGNHNLKLYAGDERGMWGLNDSISFSVDVSAPLITMHSPTATTYFDVENLLLNYTATEQGVGELDECWWKLNNGVNNSVTCNENVMFSVSEGPNTIYLFANDSFGNLNSESVTFYVSSDAPIVILGDPKNDSWHDYKIGTTFSYKPTYGDGIDTCILYADWGTGWEAKEYNNTIINDSWSNFTIDLSSYDDGSYEWSVYCNSSTGASAFAFENLTLNIDTINPEIEFDTGTELSDTSFERDWIYVNITMQETNFANMTYTLYNVDDSIIVYEDVYDTPVYELNWTMLNYENVSYAYNVTLVDMAGNTNYTETRNIFLYQTPPPKVIFINPTQGRLYPQDSNILIEVNVTDPDVVDTVYANVSWSEGYELIELQDLDSNDIYDVTFTNTSTTGRYDIVIIANNSKGYVNDEVTRYVTIYDNIYPNVTVITPTEGDSYANSVEVEISANVTDNEGVDYVKALVEWNGGSQFVVMYDVDLDGIYNGSYTTMYAGRNNITIISADFEGNINDTETTWINVVHESGGAIYCTTSPCIADSSLIAGRDSINGGNEPNQPNTIDTCLDGTKGKYMEDESLENITITNLNGTEFRAGDTLQIKITGYCSGDGSQSNFNFVYANTSSSTPNWKVKDSVVCPAGGLTQIVRNVVLDKKTGVHAFRGIVQYLGLASTTCGAGTYDDNDDLEFLVLSAREHDPPNVHIIEPINEEKYNFSDTVNIRVNVTDVSQIDTVYAVISIDKKDWKITLTDPNLDNIYTGSFTQTTFIENYTLTVFANDSFSNVNNTQSVVFEVIDSGTLTVDAQSCIPNSIDRYENVTCYAEIYDLNIPIDTVIANVTYPNGTSVIVNTENTGQYYNFTFTDTNDVVDYEVNWFANNSIGSYRVDIDSFAAYEYEKPSVIINEPFDGQNYNTGMRVKINATVTDNTRIDKVYARIKQPNNNINIIELSNIGGDLYFNEYLNTSYDGVYTITIQAQDVSGNINNTESVWVNFTYVTQSAIYCSASPCVADSTLIFGRGTMTGGNEPNQPNTLDTCSDGNTGVYMRDSSLENITITNLNGTKFRAYDTIQVNITGFCWGDGRRDNFNFVYANVSSIIPNWKVMNSVICPAGGFTTVSHTFVLDNIIGVQAFRGILQYQGSAGATCGAGAYDDNDDLEFFVYRMRETDFEIKEVKYPAKVYEGMNVQINATINNRGTTNVSNLPVEFYDLTNNVRVGDLQYISFLDSEENVTLSVNITAEIGDREIEIRIDPQNTIIESNENNNNETVTINVPSWSVFYGKITPEVVFRDGDNNTAITWDYNDFSGNVFVTYSGSNIDWDSLEALGRDVNGVVSGSDFTELDTALNMQSYNDNITTLYTSDGSTPKEVSVINVHGRDIENVPVTNSSLTSVFKTGILWDTSGDLSGSYDSIEKERIVMVSSIVRNGVGSYGTYDYEIRVPAMLREYNQEQGMLDVYVEIK